MLKFTLAFLYLTVWSVSSSGHEYSSTDSYNWTCIVGHKDCCHRLPANSLGCTHSFNDSKDCRLWSWARYGQQSGSFIIQNRFCGRRLRMLFVTLILMFQSLEPPLNGYLMARELCWGLTQCRQTGVMRKVSLSIVFFCFCFCFFLFIDELYNSSPRTPWSKRSLQQRPILWKTSRPLHWAPRVQ